MLNNIGCVHWQVNIVPKYSVVQNRFNIVSTLYLSNHVKSTLEQDCICNYHIFII